jgi:hypothetical protein
VRIAVLVALGLCGCGGAKAAAPAPTPSAALKQFAVRANAACDRHWPALTKIAPGIAGAESFGDAAYNDLANEMQSMFDDLRAIPKPPGDTRPTRLVATYGDIAYDLGQMVGNDSPGVGEKYVRKAFADGAKARRIAAPIGVTRCTTGLADRKGG